MSTVECKTDELPENADAVCVKPFKLSRTISTDNLRVWLKQEPGQFGHPLLTSERIESIDQDLGEFADVAAALETALKYGIGQYRITLDFSDAVDVDTPHQRLNSTGVHSLIYCFEIEDENNNPRLLNPGQGSMGVF